MPLTPSQLTPFFVHPEVRLDGNGSWTDERPEGDGQPKIEGGTRSRFHHRRAACASAPSVRRATRKCLLRGWRNTRNLHVQPFQEAFQGYSCIAYPAAQLPPWTIPTAFLPCPSLPRFERRGGLMTLTPSTKAPSASPPLFHLNGKRLWIGRNHTSHLPAVFASVLPQAARYTLRRTACTNTSVRSGQATTPIRMTRSPHLRRLVRSTSF
jgi:hypothetical protein